MNINAAIIDQRLSAVCNEIREAAKEELGIIDENTLKSLAFVYLTVKTVLDLSDEEAFDALTEGGEDFGTDALHISKETDNEFAVTLFQGKYKKDLEDAKSLIFILQYLLTEVKVSYGKREKRESNPSGLLSIFIGQSDKLHSDKFCRTLSNRKAAAFMPEAMLKKASFWQEMIIKIIIYAYAECMLIILLTSKSDNRS